MAIQNNFPSIRPSLNLDFANTKTLDPRITFSRASTATYYDGKTVAKAEENLLTSSDVYITNHANVGVTVNNNSSTAPDGTLTADTATFAATTSYGYRSFATGTVTGRTFTASVWLASPSKTTISLRISGITTGADQIFLSVTLTPTLTRYSVTRTFTSSDTAIQIGLDNRTSFGGDGIAGDVVVWGWQLEERSSVTAYTPTTTLPITNYIPVLQTAAANVARFDHNPVTGESLGLLIEEQRTNLLLRSQEFENAAWVKTQATVQSNVVIAPDGTLTADKVIPSTASATLKSCRSNLTLSAGTTYTFSVYAKKAEYRYLRISDNAWSTYAATYDLESGAVVSFGGSTYVSSSVSPVGNGWFICRITFTPVTTPTDTTLTYASVMAMPTTDNGGSASQGLFNPGDGFSGIYVWGAQLEAGSFPTSYIKTVAAQATRQADAASMTGANFSSWYRADAISVVAEALSPKGADPGGNSAHLFVISDSTLNERLRISRISAKTQTLAEVRYGGVVQASIDTGALADNVPIKVAAAFMLNDFAFCRNGGAVGVDTSGLMPLSPTRLEIGVANGVNLTQWNSTIKKIAFYPLRLTNAQLQALTA